jgi:hypothetical protein
MKRERKESRTSESAPLCAAEHSWGAARPGGVFPAMRDNLFLLWLFLFASLSRSFLQTQVYQNLRALFIRSKQVMACAAVLGDCLAVIRGMRLIVTAETAGEVRMAKVVGIRSPVHLHRGEHVVFVSRFHRFRGAADIATAFRVE